jgi:hypothetical protein
VTARFPPRGAPADVGHFTYGQAPPAAVWDITHNLGFFPDVQVFDNSGDEVEGDVTHVSDNELVLTFSAPISGVAYLN